MKKENLYHMQNIYEVLVFFRFKINIKTKPSNEPLFAQEFFVMELNYQLTVLYRL